MPFFVGMSKFGVAGGFLLLLTSTMEMFPVVFAAQSLGYMNFAARLFTAGCPATSELHEPIPMCVFIGLTVLGMPLIWLSKPLKE